MQQWEVRRMMYEYAPWAKDTLHRILALSSKSLPILDIQFGGACNLNCIYCDTPRYNSPCSLEGWESLLPKETWKPLSKF